MDHLLAHDVGYIWESMGINQYSMGLDPSLAPMGQIDMPYCVLAIGL